MKVLEKKIYEEPAEEEDKKVIMLLSDDSMRSYNVAVIKSRPIMNLTNALYVFPYMVNEKKAREAFEKIRLN